MGHFVNGGLRVVSRVGAAASALHDASFSVGVFLSLVRGEREGF